MAHTLTKRPDGILHSLFVGDIDGAAIEEFKQNVAPYLETATTENQLHFVADASQEGKWDFDARQAFTKYFDDQRLGHVAVVSANRFTRVISTFMVKATGRGDTVHFFATEEEAIAWLKESTGNN